MARKSNVSGGQADAPARPADKAKAPAPSSIPQDTTLSPLSPRHAAFVDNYMVHYNGARAAREAGYSKRSAYSQASDLLRNPNILAEISKRRAKLAGDLQNVSEERIKLELARCGLANMGDFMVSGDDGSPRLSFQHLTRDQTAALQEVTVEEFRDGRTTARQVRRIKFKLVPKVQSLELLAKTKGMLIDKQEHTHKHQGMIVHAMLRTIAQRQEGRPIIDVTAQAQAAPADEGEAA